MKQMKRLATSFCLTLGALLCLSGCASMAPPYTQPLAPVSEAWPSGPAYPKGAGQPSDQAAADIPWQDYFVDQRLQEVIALALNNNRDLRIAALNIERAQAHYRIQRADLLPKVDVVVAVSGQEIPQDLTSSGKSTTAAQYNVGLGVSAFELDLFGRIRSLQEVALEQYLATAEARRAIQISLIAEVVAAYLGLAADRELLLLARETLKAQEESYGLIKRRLELGATSELVLQQAQTRVEAAKVDIARYTTLVAQDENAITLVVGSPFPTGLQPRPLSETITVVRVLVPGLPSEVLLRRPDVLAAEDLLKGMNANIGAARAAFFPRISLIGALGIGSDQLGGLFNSGALAWTFAPRVTLPIFDNGSNLAALKVGEVDREIAVARYEKTIQIAFREVADALAQGGTIDEQLAAQQSLTEATAASLRLSQARFEGGVDSYLNVLDAQRSLYGAQQGVIATRLTRLLNLVNLYKVLGGGGEFMPLSPEA